MTNLPVKRNTGRRHDQAQYEEACQRALGLRHTGYTYRQIAAAEGVSVKCAHSRVTAAIRAGGKREADTERQLDLDRLDAYLVMAHARVAAGDTKALELVMRIMDRRARLLGLDVPAQVKVDATVTVQDGTDAELAEMVAEAKAAWDAADAARD